MAVIVAEKYGQVLTPDVNPAISSDLNAYDVDMWPLHKNMATGLEIVSISSSLPVTTATQVISVERRNSYMDDYYHRIHVTPGVLNVGDIFVDIESEIFVWNAHFQTKQLTNINGAPGDGLAIVGPSTPQDFAPLQELSWTLTIEQDGPPKADTVLSWAFTGLPVAELPITGNRLVVWLFRPNWEHGIDERLEWLTDILTSREYREQRRALRTEPRRYMAFGVLSDNVDRVKMDLAIFGWGIKNYALPIWHDVQLVSNIYQGQTEILCSTEHREFSADGKVLLLGVESSQYEVAEIADVLSDRIQLQKALEFDWPVARLYPLAVARLVEQPKFDRLTDDLVQTEVEFMIDDTQAPAAAVLTMYLGFPVLETKPDESQDLTLSYARLLSALDNRTGRPEQVDASSMAMQVQNHAWLLEGAAERMDFRSLCYTLAGRHKAIWVPTFMQDLRVTNVQESGFDIQHTDYTRFYKDVPGRRDIRIDLRDGSILYRRITLAIEVDSSTERLTLDPAFDPVFLAADVRKVSFLSLNRLERDAIELHHITDVEGVARAQLMFKGVADDAA